MSTSVERKENEILYEALIKLKKSGPDGYPLITVDDTHDMSGNDITIFRSNITGVQLQEYKRDAHNQAHMDKIRCTLLKHIYKLYENGDKKLMEWIIDIGENPDNINLFNRIRENIEKFCNTILTPQSSPENSPIRQNHIDSDDGEAAAAYGGTPVSELKFYNSPNPKNRSNQVYLNTDINSPTVSQFDLDLLSGKFSKPDDGGPHSKRLRFNDDEDDARGGGADAPEGGRRRRRTQRRKTKNKRVRSKSRTKHKTKKSKRKYRGNKGTKRKCRRCSRK